MLPALPQTVLLIKPRISNCVSHEKSIYMVHQSQINRMGKTVKFQWVATVRPVQYECERTSAFMGPCSVSDKRI